MKLLRLSIFNAQSFSSISFSKIQFPALIFALSILYACNKPNQQTVIKYSGPIITDTATVQLDTVAFLATKVNLSETTFDVFLHVDTDRILLFDRNLGYAYQLDDEGQVTNRYLGFGEGPGQLETGYIDGHTQLQDGKHVFFGSAFDFHVHDKEFNRLDYAILDVVGEKNAKVVRSRKELDYSEFLLYTPSYSNMNMRMAKNGNLYFQIDGYTDRFNFWSQPYFKESRILAEIEYPEFVVKKIAGRFPTLYTNATQFNGLFKNYFDVDFQNGYFIISMQRDPLIHVFDDDWAHVKSFGIPGTNMNMDHLPIYSREDWKYVRDHDLHTKGYYHQVEYFETFDLTFRSYAKGDHTSIDGLQVYKGHTLIGDLEVPKGMIVKGYKDPYFYSDMHVDEANESVWFYKFRLTDHSKLLD